MVAGVTPVRTAGQRAQDRAPRAKLTYQGQTAILEIGTLRMRGLDLIIAKRMAAAWNLVRDSDTVAIEHAIAAGRMGAQSPSWRTTCMPT
jgi:hypothetical protein